MHSYEKQVLFWAVLRNAPYIRHMMCIMVAVCQLKAPGGSLQDDKGYSPARGNMRRLQAA